MAPYVRSAGNRLVFRHPDVLVPSPGMVFTPMRIFTLGLAFNAVQAKTIADFRYQLARYFYPFGGKPVND